MVTQKEVVQRIDKAVKEWLRATSEVRKNYECGFITTFEFIAQTEAICSEYEQAIYANGVTVEEIHQAKIIWNYCTVYDIDI